jgi:uncharacterized protein (TIGR02285 family)
MRNVMMFAAVRGCFAAVCGVALSIMGEAVAATTPLAAAASAPGETPAPVAVPVIEWYLIDLPPIQIATGVLRGKGYTDRIRWRLIAGLPHYRHRIKLANVQRIMADIKAKQNICNPAFLRTPEREQFMEFGEATHAQLSNGAVVLKERMHSLARYIDSSGALALDALLNAGNSSLAVQSGRSYGTVLDGLAEKAKQGNQLMVLTSARPAEAKLGLLEKGRVAAAFLYPIELELTLRHTGQKNLYEYLPVVGNGAYTLNYLACSKSPLGKQVIEEANRIIVQERDGFIADAYREWLPATNLKMHAELHRSAFNQPLRNLPVGKKEQLLDDTIAACLLDGGTWYQQKCEPGAERNVD